MRKKNAWSQSTMIFLLFPSYLHHFLSSAKLSYHHKLNQYMLTEERTKDFEDHKAMCTFPEKVLNIFLFLQIFFEEFVHEICFLLRSSGIK